MSGEHRDSTTMVQPFGEGEDVLLLVELARRVNRNKSTVGRWRQAGDLGCVRVGGRWTVSRESWARFLDRCNPPAPSPRPLSQLIVDKRREADLARDEARAAALGL
jgi:hypothetical protein